MVSDDVQIKQSWLLLKLGFGLAAIGTGIDKFLNLTVDWSSYISPFFIDVLPVTPDMFMFFVGIIEILFGILILLPRFTSIGAYGFAIWMVGIVINLWTFSPPLIDIANRDLLIALGLIGLGRLSQAIDERNVLNNLSELTKVEGITA